MEKTTIQIDKDLLNLLKETREHPRQTYEELIQKMIKIFVALKKRNQYDEFLHKIQQQKMRDIWENKEDDIWENA